MHGGRLEGESEGRLRRKIASPDSLQEIPDLRGP